MKVGTVNVEGELAGVRDAIHVPLVTVTTDEYLNAGDSVEFTDYTFAKVRSCGRPSRHGIIDPFIKQIVKPGDIFKVLLEPDMNIQVRHHFDIFVEVREAPDVSDDSCRGCYN